MTNDDIVRIASEILKYQEESPEVSGVIEFARTIEYHTRSETAARFAASGLRETIDNDMIETIKAEAGVNGMDEKRKAAGQKLLDAAHEFWGACHAEGQYGAVQWLEGTAGELVIFTRREYRDRLMANIDTLPNVEKIHFFGEQMPVEEE